MLGDGWIERGAGAAGGVLGAVFLWRCLVFICNFLAGRYDARQTRLEAREARVDGSLANRLTHLETNERENLQRIRVLEARVANAEGWVSALADELRMKDPGNPKLAQLSKALRAVTPVIPDDPVLQEILRHAGNAIDEGDSA